MCNWLSQASRRIFWHTKDVGLAELSQIYAEKLLAGGAVGRIIGRIEMVAAAFVALSAWDC